MAYAQSERSVLTKATHWPTVVIDNVAEYYGQSTREEWDYGRDFPNLAPPFHAAFFEYKYPRTWIAADDDGVLRDVGDSLHATHSGSLVVGWPYEAFAEKVYYEHSLGVNRVEPAMYSSVCELQGHAQWVLQFSWWAAVRGHSSPLNTCAAVWFFVDAHGAYIRHLNKPGVLALILGQKHDVAAELHPVLLALSFMHCKNVARRDSPDTEGPYDKVITFLKVGTFRSEVAIAHGCEAFPDVAFLGGKSLNQLIDAELRGTEYALYSAGRMSQTITLPEVNAYTIGQLLCFFEMATAYAGELLDVDAFNQPGVENSKLASYAVLGNTSPKYLRKAAEMKDRPELLKKYLL